LKVKFLTQIRGVMLLALRASFRARVVSFLLLVQLVCALTLPSVVKGDGTPAGDLEILLTYTLGFCFAIQALATLWAACSLFASEIASLRIQMSVVKPISFTAMWLGRWFALLLLNGLLLIVVYLMVYGRVRLTQHEKGWPDDVIPASMHLSRPLLLTPEEEALHIFNRMKLADELPKNLSRKQILTTLTEQARERYDVINPGDEFHLDFNVARAVRPEDSIVLRFKFDTAYGTRQHVKGVCRLAASHNPNKQVERQIDNITQSVIALTYPAAEFLDLSTPDQDLRNFTLLFNYTSDETEASALLLRMRQDIALLIPGGSFEMNLARSAFLQWCVLAILSAFGLTLSACFSFPVASFTASVVLALVMISGGVLPMVTQEDEQKRANRIGIEILRATRYITRSATETAPLTSIVRGERIAREVILTGALWNMGLMPLAFMILACAALRRRELANV